MMTTRRRRAKFVVWCPRLTEAEEERSPSLAFAFESVTLSSPELLFSERDAAVAFCPVVEND